MTARSRIKKVPTVTGEKEVPARERIKKAAAIFNEPAFHDAVAACGGDFNKTTVAAKHALIDWMSRGQRAEIEKHQEQAQALRDGYVRKLL
ncbi:MAG: hypothetical protein ACYCTF_14310 [Acidiferrobacter sp.]